MKVFRRIMLAFTFIWNHSLVKNERFSAIYRYIKFHFRYRNGQECIIPFLEHSLLIKKGEGSQAHYYTYLADFEEMLFLLHYLNKDDRFIDVGANIGAYSILAAGQIGCNTLSFEPSIQNHKLLKSNIQLNNLKNIIKTYNYALGEIDKVSNIRYKGTMTYIINDDIMNSQKVLIKKLDDFTDYGELIKIDVEGYEEFVLKGATKVLKHLHTNALIVELGGARHNRYGSSNDKIHKILINNHFSPIKYDPYTRRIKKLKIYREDQFNTIYIRDEKFVENRLINSPKYKIGNQYI